jgi:hypothetical protein
MIKCPKCNATLPDGAGHCQFCGNTFAAQPVPGRPPRNEDPDYGGSGSPQWVWPAYYLISAWWILNGIWGVIEVLLSKDPGSLFGIIAMLLNVVTALVGLGLILRVELARGIVNVLCFLQILEGIFGLLGSFAMTFVFGLFGAIAMIMSVIQIALAVVMIFVIGETESRAPNF